MATKGTANVDQHYVPAGAYLSNFTQGRTRKSLFFRIDEQRQTPTTPDDVCSDDDFYTAENRHAESTFWVTEGNWARLVAKLEASRTFAKGAFTPGDLVTVASVMTSLHIRNPSYALDAPRERFSYMAPAITALRLADFAGVTMSASSPIQRAEADPLVTKALLKHWSVYFALAPFDIFTSDNPAIRYRLDEQDTRAAIYAMPMSSRVWLFLFDESRIKLRTTDASEEDFNRLEFSTAVNAFSQVFSTTEVDEENAAAVSATLARRNRERGREHGRIRHGSVNTFAISPPTLTMFARVDGRELSEE